MTIRVALTAAQHAEIEAGRFVRIGAWTEGILVGRVAGAWRVYRNECRHRALPLDLGARSPMSDDGRFLLCHQHGALYRLEDGRCFAGPCAGASLLALTVHEDTDGTLLIET
jgi:nitrite reductase/ring-hydroxylating ferredoxin subunit